MVKNAVVTIKEYEKSSTSSKEVSRGEIEEEKENKE
jgi:hypothetical protein